MAERQRVMESRINPISRIANRVIEKYNLFPPINIKELVGKYAKLSFIHIPYEDVDGITLNLKVPGKSTHVIVNREKPSVRQRFTMAHELGHILIPWHVGDVIVDAIGDGLELDSDSNYWRREAEANTFAGELLIPFSYVSDLLSKKEDLSEVHNDISANCQISVFAAAIRLAKLLPANTVYASERNGFVEFSGHTEGTVASQLIRESVFPENPFEYSVSYFKTKIKS